MWRCVECGGVWSVDVCGVWRCVECGRVWSVEVCSYFITECIHMHTHPIYYDYIATKMDVT